MRILFFFILIIVLASCDHPKKPYIEELTWPKRIIKLDNDLGVLTIRLPAEFDTIYFRKVHSDSICEDYYIREFYKKGFLPSPIDYSDGVMYYIDSIYSFSISRWPLNCKEAVLADSFRMNFIIKNYDAQQKFDRKKAYKYQIKNLEEINKRDFIILGYNGLREMILEDTKKFEPQTLEAITSVNGQIIELNFNCAVSNCDSFIPKMYKALKTVQIKPN